MGDMDLPEKALRAKAVFPFLSNASTFNKNQALSEISKALLGNSNEIYSANQQDLAQTNHKNKHLIELEPLDVIVKDLFHIMDLPDPVGDVFDSAELPDGLKLTKYRIPIGTIGLVLDDHPRTIINAAALAIKSSNSIIVWAGKGIAQTSRILIKMIQTGLEAADLPIDAVQLVHKNDENSLQEFVRYKSGLDLLLLSGSPELTRFCRENSSIPLIYEKLGVCHLYVDQSVNIKKSISVINNAKTQSLEANNSISTLLIHEAIASQLLPLLFKTLQDENISFRLDSKCWNLFVSLFPDVGVSQLAEPNDWDTAWHSNILNIKLVSNMDEAIEHIRLHGAGYCEGILSDHPLHAITFASLVDSSSIMINSSTRLFDGGQMNLGPQALISTQKIHAVGPVGLKELMSYKWLIHGNYNIRE